MNDDELKEAVAKLDGALMRPMWVNRSARALLAPNLLRDRDEAKLRGARTRELNSARQVDAVIRAYVKEHPSDDA